MGKGRGRGRQRLRVVLLFFLLPLSGTLSTLLTPTDSHLSQRTSQLP
jgi:hypothetical protein